MWGLICSYVQIVMLLVSFVQDTLYSFPSDIQRDESFFIWFWGFSFCVCLRACVCAWVQSLDCDHCRIKPQFSVCVASPSSNRVDCAHWHLVQNPDLSVWLHLITVLLSLRHIAASILICHFLPNHQLCLNQSQGFVRIKNSLKAFLCYLHVAVICPAFWTYITWLSNRVKESVRCFSRQPAFTFCLLSPTGSWRGCWRRVMIRRSSQWQLTTLESMCDITRVASGKASFCRTSKWLNAKSESHQYASMSLSNEGSLVLLQFLLFPPISPLEAFFFKFIMTFDNLKSSTKVSRRVLIGNVLLPPLLSTASHHWGCNKYLCECGWEGWVFWKWFQKMCLFEVCSVFSVLFATTLLHSLQCHCSSFSFDWALSFWAGRSQWGHFKVKFLSFIW